MPIAKESVPTQAAASTPPVTLRWLKPCGLLMGPLNARPWRILQRLCKPARQAPMSQVVVLSKVFSSDATAGLEDFSAMTPVRRAPGPAQPPPPPNPPPLPVSQSQLASAQGNGLPVVGIGVGSQAGLLVGCIQHRLPPHEAHLPGSALRVRSPSHRSCPSCFACKACATCVCCASRASLWSACHS